MELIASIIFYSVIACQDYLVRQVETRPERATVSMQTKQHALVTLNESSVFLQCKDAEYIAVLVSGNERGIF